MFNKILIASALMAAIIGAVCALPFGRSCAATDRYDDVAADLTPAI